MTGQQFLQALLRARRLNPNSMGEKAGNHALQSTAARFLSGVQSRPRTMQPIADFFGVDVGGFFDPDKARAELRRLGLADPDEQADGTAVNESSPPYQSGLGDALNLLARALNALPDEQRETAAERLRVLAMAPDSKKALDSVRALLGGQTETSRHTRANAPTAEKMPPTAKAPRATKATYRTAEKV